MPAKFARSVSVTRELAALIDVKVATGHDRRASEIVRGAMRLLAEQDPCAGPRHDRAKHDNHDG